MLFLSLNISSVFCLRTSKECLAFLGGGKLRMNHLFSATSAESKHDDESIVKR